ncbi:MAG: SCO family protein, partial [Bacteroidota bacterium]
MSKSPIRSNWFCWALALSVCYLGACTQSAEKHDSEELPYYREASFRPHWVAMNSSVRDTFHQIAPFSLTNQLGETVNESTVEGKLYVANFFFTVCPGICPKMMDNLKTVQDTFGLDEQVLILSHSVTPGFDSVAVLADYAQRNEIQAKTWHLLTGDRAHIYELG